MPRRTGEESAIEPQQFRALLRRLAAAVVVITVADAQQRPVGFTATSFTSVSLVPPIVSFCLDRASSSWPAVAGADYVGVHILTHDQEQLARTFATRGIDRFAAPTAWQPGPHGVPLLDRAGAWMVCRITQRVYAGDHVIVLSEPLTGEHTDTVPAPLLYHMGTYTAVP